MLNFNENVALTECSQLLILLHISKQTFSPALTLKLTRMQIIDKYLGQKSLKWDGRKVQSFPVLHVQGQNLICGTTQYHVRNPLIGPQYH